MLMQKFAKLIEEKIALPSLSIAASLSINVCGTRGTFDFSAGSRLIRRHHLWSDEDFVQIFLLFASSLD